MDRWNTDPRTATPLMMLRRSAQNELDDTRTMERRSTRWMTSRDTGTHGRPTRRHSSAELVWTVSFRRAKRPLKWSGAHSRTRRRAHRSCMNWPEQIKTQPHDDGDNCFQHFDSKGPCGMTVNNDIDDDSATKHNDSHTRNSHRQSV